MCISSDLCCHNNSQLSPAVHQGIGFTNCRNNPACSPIMPGGSGADCRKTVRQVRSANISSSWNGPWYYFTIPFLLLEWRYFNEFPDSFNDNLRNWFWIVLTTEYKCHHEFRSAKRHISCISSCCNHAYCRPGDEHGNTDTCICIHYG